MNEEKNKKHSNKVVSILVVTFIILLLIFILLPALKPSCISYPRNICKSNLKQLGLIFQIYAQGNSNSYPIPEKWCDLITPYFVHGQEKILQCPFAEQAKCNYAMNLNCEPDSPPDTVFLFETKGGWNLSGGAEILATENHSGKGCCILFNNGSYKFIEKDKIQSLKWK